MNNIEQFHTRTYRVTKLNSQINDKHTVQPTGIFQILVRMGSDKGHQYTLSTTLSTTTPKHSYC
jgi:hypothetical protein